MTSQLYNIKIIKNEKIALTGTMRNSIVVHNVDL